MTDAIAAHDLSCVVHVHTTYSDGTATVPELLEAARGTGTEAVLLTDHDSLAARRDGWEGDHDGVFLLVGEEVSPKHEHYLAFGVDEEIAHQGLSPLEIAAAVRASGGVGFPAHPFSRGSHLLFHPVARRIVAPHGWPALRHPEGLDGLELWSLLTDAAEGWRTPFEALRWLRDPQAAIASGPPAHHLRAWDALSAARRVPAIGGLDGHQHGLRIRGRVHSPLPHSKTFQLLRTHLLIERPLSGDADVDGRTIVAALRAGSAWLACPCVAPAHGARLWAEGGEGETVAMGGEAAAGPSVLRARLPSPADVTVLRNGRPIHGARTARIDLDIGPPGVYRLEARIAGRLWLLSNPVHLRWPRGRRPSVREVDAATAGVSESGAGGGGRDGGAVGRQQQR